MATEKWVAGSGVGLTWTTLLSGTEMNSIVNGNAIQLGVVIDNSTAFDIFADLSIALGSITSGAGAYVGAYFYPLNQDGTTYGDNRFGSSAAGPPPAPYYIGAISLVPSVTQAQEGTLRGFILPAGKGIIVLFNQAGATLATSGNAAKYRTYNRQVL